MEYISPGASLVFRYDAANFLAVGETLATVTWTLEAGITGSGQVDQTDYSELTIAADASSAGKTCKVEVEAVTNRPNTFRRTWFVKIQEQLA